MQDWRDFAKVIKTGLVEEKVNGASQVPIEKLIDFVDRRISDFTQKDKICILNEINKEKEDKYLDLIVDKNIAGVVSEYEKSTSYTNLMLTAGYASFFGLWALTKEYVSPVIHGYAGICIVISIVSFVFFEVYKMMSEQHRVAKYAQKLHRARVKRTFQEQNEVLTEKTVQSNLITIAYIPIWIVTSAIAILFALTGTGCLMWGLVSHLAKSI